MSLRQISSSFLAIAAISTLLPGQSAQHRRELPDAVAAGDVDSDSAILWARAEDRGPILFQLSERPDFRHGRRTYVRWVGDPMEPIKVEVRGLREGRRYFYRAFTLRGVSEGTFRTPGRAGNRDGVRFGVTGDHRGELSPFVAVRNVPARDLDLFLELGDTIYADYPSPQLPIPQATTLEEFRIKHEEVVAERFGYRFLSDARSSTAWLATIDDHEVTNDFAGGAHPSTDPRFPFTTETFIHETALYRAGLTAFLDYHPMAERRYGRTGDPRTAGKLDLYRRVRFDDDAVIHVLDARSFRDEGLPAVADPTDPQQVGAFLAASFTPGRTMLGEAQIQRLLADLAAAERDGITWKFVMVPEPIQNLGVVGASDRFEGYAAERTRILAAIEQGGIRNVVFVAADLHGTLVNDLSYQTAPFGPQIPTSAFEVITGAVAFDAPLGPSLVDIGTALGIITPQQRAFYDSLPREGRDAFVTQLIDSFIAPLGYSALGLADSTVPARLTTGAYTAAHTYGWTEFHVDPRTSDLTVTTYGVDPYTEADLVDPNAVLARQPAVVSQFVVTAR